MNGEQVQCALQDLLNVPVSHQKAGQLKKNDYYDAQNTYTSTTDQAVVKVY